MHLVRLVTNFPFDKTVMKIIPTTVPQQKLLSPRRIGLKTIDLLDPQGIFIKVHTELDTPTGHEDQNAGKNQQYYARHLNDYYLKENAN